MFGQQITVQLILLSLQCGTKPWGHHDRIRGRRNWLYGRGYNGDGRVILWVSLVDDTRNICLTPLSLDRHIFLYVCVCVPLSTFAIIDHNPIDFSTKHNTFYPVVTHTSHRFQKVLSATKVWSPKSDPCQTHQKKRANNVSMAFICSLEQ